MTKSRLIALILAFSIVGLTPTWCLGQLVGKPISGGYVAIPYNSASDIPTPSASIGNYYIDAGVAKVKLPNGTSKTILYSDSAGVGTVTSVSVTTANGVSGSVANASTTPAITITLGAITPTTVNGLTISTTTGILSLANSSTLATSGANSITLTSTGATNVTLPTSGTLVNSAVTTLSSLTSIGTITTGVWQGTDIAASYLADTSVTPGSYTNVNLTVDQQGRITAASNGSSGGSVNINDLGDAAAAGTVDNANYKQSWTWNSLGANTGLELTSSSTAAASNTQTLFSASLSGANSTSTQTTYSGYFSNTHTGTSSTNIGAAFIASGGTTNLAATFENQVRFLKTGTNTKYDLTVATASTDNFTLTRVHTNGSKDIIKSAYSGTTDALTVAADNQYLIGGQLGIHPTAAFTTQAQLHVVTNSNLLAFWEKVSQNTRWDFYIATGGSDSFSIRRNHSGGSINSVLNFTYDGTNDRVGINTTPTGAIFQVQQITDQTQTSAPVAFDVNSVGAAGEMTASSGTQTFARIAPVLNQSSTAAYTALLINATHTAVGSGTKRLTDWQVGGSTVANVSSVGLGTFTGISSGGDITITTANGLSIKETSNGTMGTGNLTLGIAIISTTKVTANSRVFFSRYGTAPAKVGELFTVSRVNGTSFTVNSLDSQGALQTGDEGSFIWWLVEPN